MSKSQGKNRKGRPGVMPSPRPVPSARTPKPVRLEGKDDNGEKENAEDAKPPVAEGQAVEQPVDAQGGSQSGGQGGGGNQP